MDYTGDWMSPPGTMPIHRLVMEGRTRPEGLTSWRNRIREKDFMKAILTLTAGLMELWSANTWAVATIGLNNYGIGAGPIYDMVSWPWGYASASRTYLQIETPGGPVMPIGESSSVLRLVEDGYYYAGIGIVPGVPDGAIVEFTLRVWMDAPTYDPSIMSGAAYFAQATGSWNPNAIPPVPPTGPDLISPRVNYVIIPEPQTITLGLIGGAAMLFSRFRA